MKFIVAVDGSKEGKEAIKYAINIAKPLNAEIEAVHSIVPEIYTENQETLIEDMSEAENRGKKILQETKQLAEKKGKTIETTILYGDPAEKIAKHAQNSDGIFIGHRGLSEEHQKMVGSVAHEIVRKAKVPVTVVK